MRCLLPCLIILLLTSSPAFAQVALQRPSVTISPSSFNIEGKNERDFRVNYAFKVGAATGRRTTLLSRAGNFLAGSVLTGANNVPLRVDIKDGYGEVSEVIRVSQDVIEGALKTGARRFVYKRVFRAEGLSLDTTVEFNITIAELTITGISLYFDGGKKEITIPLNKPSIRAYARLRLQGKGVLKGYWEIDGVIVRNIAQHLSFVKSLVIESPQIIPKKSLRAGMHKVKFVVTRPEIRIGMPEISFLILPADFKGDNLAGYASRQIIVTFEQGAVEKGYINGLIRRYGLRIIDEYKLGSIGNRVILFETRTEDIIRIIESIRKEGKPVIAQPNRIFRTMGDPLSNRQYGNAILKLRDIHARYTGRGTRVAVLDTGVDTEHEDLKGRIVLFKNLVRGNDYRAEIHGTAVAGIISSAINGVGIEGVAPEAELVALRACIQASMEKAIGDCFTDTLARALDVAIVDRVNIVNMSFGGEEDRLLARLIDKGIEEGIIFVAPVGNEVTQKDLRFPASHPGVVSVGGLDERMQPYPNPDVVKETTINAPAVNILTTFPHNRYNFITGTSLSSAYISGILALAIEKDKDINRRGLPAYNGDVCRWEEQLLGLSLCNRR